MKAPPWILFKTHLLTPQKPANGIGKNQYEPWHNNKLKTAKIASHNHL